MGTHLACMNAVFLGWRKLNKKHNQVYERPPLYMTIKYYTTLKRTQ